MQNRLKAVMYILRRCTGDRAAAMAVAIVHRRFVTINLTGLRNDMAVCAEEIRIRRSETEVL